MEHVRLHNHIYNNFVFLQSTLSQPPVPFESSTLHWVINGFFYGQINNAGNCVLYFSTLRSSYEVNKKCVQLLKMSRFKQIQVVPEDNFIKVTADIATKLTHMYAIRHILTFEGTEISIIKDIMNFFPLSSKLFFKTRT